MKTRDKDTSAFTKFTVFFILIFLALLLSEGISSAQNTKWQKIQEVEIPEGLEIHSGINSEGIPKYWFEFDGVKVFINAQNHKDYIEGNVTLILTEWKVIKTGKYRYTVRRKDNNTSNSNKIDIDKLFYGN